VVYYQQVAPSALAPQNYATPINNFTYPQPSQQPLQQTPFAQPPWTDSTHNPFMNQGHSQVVQQQALSVNTATIQPGYVNNPFTRSPTRIGSPLGQIPEQSQPSFYSAPQQQPQLQPQQPLQTMNPFLTQASGFQQPYQTQRPDKASILALYNYPHLAPQLSTVQPSTQPSTAEIPIQSPVAQQPRSASTPLPGNKNPFLSGGAATSMMGNDPFASSRSNHVSRESVNLGMDMAWANGRHSPDAFASLSARQ
jgi:hypothetical protein